MRERTAYVLRHASHALVMHGHEHVNAIGERLALAKQPREVRHARLELGQAHLLVASPHPAPPGL